MVQSFDYWKKQEFICQSKVVYRSAKKAREAAQKQRPWKNLEPYRCICCRKWHLTKKRKKPRTDQARGV